MRHIQRSIGTIGIFLCLPLFGETFLHVSPPFSLDQGSNFNSVLLSRTDDKGSVQLEKIKSLFSIIQSEPADPKKRLRACRELQGESPDNFYSKVLTYYDPITLNPTIFLNDNEEDKLHNWAIWEFPDHLKGADMREAKKNVLELMDLNLPLENRRKAYKRLTAMQMQTVDFEMTD